jgi:ribosomal protein S18 acetylase RimI-like enzyme
VAFRGGGPVTTDAALRLEWRGRFDNRELSVLHAEGFGGPVRDDDWVAQVEDHSLGWVTAREAGRLVGFINVAWDGGVHAFLLDTLVTAPFRGRGIGVRLVAMAVEASRAAGCEWLHVDWDGGLAAFYLDACGFRPAEAGLIQL